MTFDPKAFEAEVDAAVEQMTEESTSDSKETPDTDESVEKADTEETNETAETEETNDTAEADTEASDDGAEDTEEAEVEEKADISDAAIEEAVRAGIPLSQARQFSSEEALRNVVQSINDALDFGKEDEGEDGKEVKSPLDELPELNPDDHDPSVIKMFEAMKGVIQKQQETLDSFRSQQEQATRASQETAAKEVEQWFDKQVESLGEDFADALGSGAYATLDRGSSQFANRDKIAQQMAVMMAGYQATGQELPPREEVFDAAARVVLRDEFASQREKQVGKKLAKRAGTHVSRVSGKSQKKNQSPFEATAALIDEKFGSGG